MLVPHMFSRVQITGDYLLLPPKVHSSNKLEYRIESGYGLLICSLINDPDAFLCAWYSAIALTENGGSGVAAHI